MDTNHTDNNKNASPMPDRPMKKWTKIILIQRFGMTLNPINPQLVSITTLVKKQDAKLPIQKSNVKRAFTFVAVEQY